jgi:uncharacterized membrane protein
VNDDTNAPSAQDPEEMTPTPRPRNLVRRLVGTVVPTVLVLGAVGGGIGYMKVTVDRADTTAATVEWKKADHEPSDDPAGATYQGRTDNALSSALLPVPPLYQLGPDAGEYSNDSWLSEKQATAAMKSEGAGLTGSARRAFNKAVDKLGVKGLATRTYAADSDDLVVEIDISPLTDPKAVKSWYLQASQLLSVGTKGPKVAGYKTARCFLPPQRLRDDTSSTVEDMVCVAYKDEMFVGVTASGTKPVKSSAVAELLKAQLDHIASPGTSI